MFLGNGAGPTATDASNNRLYINNAAGTPLIFGDFSTDRVAIQATDPTVALDVNGQIRARTWSGSSSTTVCRDTDGILVPCSSDARLKRNVVPLVNERDILTVLASLRAVAFDWDTAQPRAAHAQSRRDIGFLAQEVEPVLPEVVNTEADGYKSVDYPKLTAVLVEVAKSQQRELEYLRAEAASQRQTLADLTRRLEEQQLRLDRIARSVAKD